MFSTWQFLRSKNSRQLIVYSKFTLAWALDITSKQSRTSKKYQKLIKMNSKQRFKREKQSLSCYVHFHNKFNKK
jgi:hypothetical protein